MNREQQIEKILSKISMILLSTHKVKIEIHKQGNSIIWKQEISEENKLKDVDSM